MKSRIPQGLEDEKLFVYATLSKRSSSRLVFQFLFSKNQGLKKAAHCAPRLIYSESTNTEFLNTHTFCV